ncbi:MAG TPA: poly-beta-1,6-N-acetyl-D-glucosamine N-deacetylase PgaB [Syntrophales bacterium]|nr:poly-beta-1,6-N-acetyl-D-glucosamine N-deacetylase PgaB [Syntrophales bacterium]HOX94661.1 poly-beta-1,6-N-acetyl-D-glucosamine N-deacetylase PgaB [Syntrophales bacterium]HPI56834.1 poly-beta-1,6-N-acetyl-D-glucosamine N-deacetylase PgaB [Syntrophales bacterium]HPN25728.1 poly-beta-1,6-N-acetyl-D-glucosamine N-deacetylase PgaB [Syntrophales bacterium]HQM28693.1 poly-beta-1,6-N-acetyl-D-glucosamine N-deacetylase PgaB [Syntrophales bacterium]
MSLARTSSCSGFFKNGLLLSLVLVLLAARPCEGADRFITLVYHDIPETAVERDDVSQRDFVNQMEYLRSHGYTFINPRDVLAAAAGEAALPDKAVLLTFDDAYSSFYTFVYPLLRLYKCPAVLSVVTSWIDQGVGIYKDKTFMTWAQIREVADSGLVTLASHSHELHRLVSANPQGNVERAPFAFLYLPEEKRYETEEEFRKRIRDDLAVSVQILSSKAGVRPAILTWPFGSYNTPGLEEAKKLGFKIIMTLDFGFSDVKNLDRLSRHYMESEIDWLPIFNAHMARGLRHKHQIRGVQVDLDRIVVKGSYEQSDRNLGLLIERFLKLGVNTVFLQGFCDAEGSGNIRSLYFPNSVLPVEMDFLSHAVNRLRARQMKVLVWMPALSFELPDGEQNEALKVREMTEGKVTVSRSWYRRMSPFDGRSLDITRAIFRDLAAHVDFDGVLFQDDAYLNDREDFHPEAVKKFRVLYGVEPRPAQAESDAAMKENWIRLKTETLDRYLLEIAATVKRYRPHAVIARNIYSEVVTNPGAEEWFAQDLNRFLKHYDYTVIMAYAATGGVTKPRGWYEKLHRAVADKGEVDRVIFKLQAYDWGNKEWLDDQAIRDDLTFLLALGVRHVAYYPDDVFLNKPDVDAIASILSSRYRVDR